LEFNFEVMVVNAQHLKNVPGRKTNVKDAEWIADLLRHGLLRGSFIPPLVQRDLRDLTRQRITLVREKARVVNRLQKLLEWANIKLASVVTDITGVSARRMLQAIVDGQTDVQDLAKLAKGRLVHKLPQLEEALLGKVRDHHRFLIQQHLNHLELELLIAEIGTDMGRFPSASHLAKWARLCPGNHESAGKRLSGRTGRSNPWLRTSLVQAANAAVRCRNLYLRVVYRRLAGCRGRKKALIAIAHRILTALYHMFKKCEPYRDLGIDYLSNQSQKQNSIQRLHSQASQLGYQLELTPIN